MQLEIILVWESSSNRLSSKVHDIHAKIDGRNSMLDEELQAINDSERESISLL